MTTIANRKPRSRRYAFAAKWIADNDNPGDNEGKAEIASYMSTMLVADLFSCAPEQVAEDVHLMRLAETPRRLIRPLGNGLP